MQRQVSKSYLAILHVEKDPRNCEKLSSILRWSYFSGPSLCTEIGPGTGVAVLNSQVVPISQVVAETGFAVVGTDTTAYQCCQLL